MGSGILTGTVEAKLKKPIQKVGKFAGDWGVPIVAGLAGFAAGDFIDIKGRVSAATPVRTVSVLGFGVDVLAFLSIMIYALFALLSLKFGSMAHAIVGRVAFVFFVGAMLRQVTDMFGIVQDIVVVS